MPMYEYKAIPAPAQGVKAKGVKSTEDRFALALTNALNDEAMEGWEYVRAETLPCDERRGLTGTQTTYQNVLVFRRELDAVADVPEARASRDVPESGLPPLTLGEPTRMPLQARRDPPISRTPEPQDDA